MRETDGKDKYWGKRRNKKTKEMRKGILGE